MNETVFYCLIVLLVACVVLLLVRVFRQNRQTASDGAGEESRRELQAAIRQMGEWTERQLREQVLSSAQGTRQEISATLAQFQHSVTQQMANVSGLQNDQIRTFSEQLVRLSAIHADQLEKMRESMALQSHSARQEQSDAMQRFGDTLHQSLTSLTESNARRMAEVRAVLEEKIRDLQTDNAKKLEEMRKTVDEKLHATLEQRLGESFKLVSERLEKVHQGLGEMHQLAMGVGDLKRVLTNVKTRGTWGEVQLEMLLEQTMTPGQYAKNVETIPGSGAIVEFAIRLPGKNDDTCPVWLPVDAKFPKEQYERLMDAAERADADGVAQSAKELERALRLQAKTIAEKYVAPPHTTDFALLFLPTEGLYAEVMRRPGLSDELQRTYRISIAGPSTLSALLNSLQMGFRTLALEKRSSEVWEILGAVKTEFTKFGHVLDATQKVLERAAKNIDDAKVRTRQMSNKLKRVEALPAERAQELLQVKSLPDDAENPVDGML